MSWIYKNEEFTEDMIQSYVGFIYLITEVATGKQYVGQKVFWNKVAKPPLKGKTNWRISKKQSDWQTYHGSNDELKELVAKGGEFKREILSLCTAKSEMNYLETKEIFVRDVLLKPNEYFNSWISTRINRNQLKKFIR